MRVEQIILYGQKGNRMQLDTGNRVILLEAESPEELAKWVEALQVLVPKRQGPLKKRKERQGFFRIKTGGYISSDWNHRFFVLQDKFLFYYDSCGRKYRGGQFRGLIAVRTITEILPVKDDPNCFRIATPERNLHLRAKNSDEALQWIKSIKEAKAALTGGAPATRQQDGPTMQNFT
jgi:hypothetical protein